MLQVKNITKEFDSPAGIVVAVKDVSFRVPQGSFASIIGTSGSGKTTLLSLLGALDKPTSGEVKVDGKDIARMDGHALNAYRRKQIGFVFQSYNLVPNLSALENVMLPLEFSNVPARLRKSRAEELLNQVGISEDKQMRKPGHLSGGEQQRVSIARALANEPKLILADEPTGNLDSHTGKKIFDLLHKLTRSQKTTIIAVTHDLSIAGKTDQTFRLSDGKLVI